MKKNFAFGLSIIYLTSQLFLGSLHAFNIYPIFDTSEFSFPRNFRIFQIHAHEPPLNFRGLNKINASGSSQFSESALNELIEIFAIHPNKLIVLDLRQESHGFINGRSVSWTDGIYNYGNLNKNRSAIEIDEFQRLQLAVEAGEIIINPKCPAIVTVHTVNSERNIVEKVGAIYVRLPVTDHNPPSNEIIDQFILLVKNLSEDQWIHCHCKAGKGRTTTFLALLDIMKNAQQISLEDILERQKIIGGTDLNIIQKQNLERSRAANERLDFLKKFHLYCQQVPNFHISWSDWINLLPK